MGVFFCVTGNDITFVQSFAITEIPACSCDGLKQLEKLPEGLLPVLECSSSAFANVAGLAETEQVRRKVTAVLAIFVHRGCVKLERK